MKKLNILLSIAAITICTVLFINSCKKDDNNNNSNSSSGTGSTYKTSIAGIIIDENNNPLSGVNVTAHGQTTSTDAHGTFVFDNISVPTARCIVMATKTSYLNATFAAIPHANNVTYFKIVMLSAPAPTSFSSSAGATINLTGGAIVQLPVNGYVNASGASYTGTVNAVARYLSPPETNFALKIPGGDLLATDSTNKDVILYSYGMVTVQLTDNASQPLQLANGSTAILTLPVIASQSSTAPASIPLWYFDETTSLWKQQGQATKIGNNYVGTVAHFSWWNCDLGLAPAFIHGRVVDCEGIGVPNVVVTIYNTYFATTDNNGNYSSIVGINTAFPVQVLASNNIGGVFQNSQIENIPALVAQQNYNVPDLIIPCITKIAGTITGCNGPGSGFVYATFSGLYNFTYCNDGVFILAVQATSSLTIQLYSGAATHTINNIVSGVLGVTTNIGNTVLCDDVAQPDNSFYIDGNGYIHELISIDTSSTNNNAGMTIYGTNHSNGQPVTLNINTPLATGTYTLNPTSGNYLIISMNNSSSPYDNSIIGSNASCTLTQVQGLGGRIIGTFSGTLEADSFGDPLGQVIITNGKFNITRTQ